MAAEEFAPQLDRSPRPWVVVTTLVGVARPEEIQAAAQREKESAAQAELVGFVPAGISDYSIRG